jgi:hypothetical protein
MYLGPMLLGIATLRAGVFPRPAALLLLVGPPAAIMVIFAHLGVATVIPGVALLVGGFAWCGYALWVEAMPAPGAVVDSAPGAASQPAS